MKKLKIALTGRLRTGKDYVAEKSSGRTVGFADPLYEIVEFLTGYSPSYKDTIPFVRSLYQTIGQWGRGEVNDQYPLDMDRVLFAGLVKSGMFKSVCQSVDFSKWGTPDIWLDSMLGRSDSLPDNRIFCTNVRFKNEFDRLKIEGWDHWHVICSRQTYEERLAQVGMSINDPRLRDVSENLAGLFDNSIINILKTEPTGAKLKVIWNDSRTSPSDRLHSLEEFQQYLENNECEPEYSSFETDPRTPDDGVGSGPVEERPPVEGAEKPKDRDPAERRRNRNPFKVSW